MKMICIVATLDSTAVQFQPTLEFAWGGVIVYPLKAAICAVKGLPVGAGKSAVGVSISMHGACNPTFNLTPNTIQVRVVVNDYHPRFAELDHYLGGYGASDAINFAEVALVCATDIINKGYVPEDRGLRVQVTYVPPEYDAKVNPTVLTGDSDAS